MNSQKIGFGVFFFLISSEILEYHNEIYIHIVNNIYIREHDRNCMYGSLMIYSYWQYG